MPLHPTTVEHLAFLTTRAAREGIDAFVDLNRRMADLMSTLDDRDADRRVARILSPPNPPASASPASPG